MALSHRLRRWTAANLISEAQAQQILAFEQESKRPLLLYSIASLGALAIAIGFLSIVAANWDLIPGRVKIAIDLCMVLALSYGIVRLYNKQGPLWVQEVALLSHYGLVLASIALIGQVYQLGGKTHEALAIWTGLTALLMVRARSGATAFIWLMGLQLTYGTWLVWIGDRSENGLKQLALAAVYWAPLLCLVIGRSRWIRGIRPALAHVFESVGWLELIVCASMGTLAFYENTGKEDWHFAYIGAAISALLSGWVWTTFSSSPQGRTARWLLPICWLFAHVPVFISPGDLGVVSAFAWIALWFAVAVVAHHTGKIQILNLATALIGIRILIVYFEVFGSLLDTGLGLVIGGLLTLGLVWLWARKSRDFKREHDAKEVFP